MGLSQLQIAEFLGVAGAARAQLWSTYRSSAKTRGLDFLLSRDHFYELVTSECEYCGAPPNNRTRIADEGTVFEIPCQGIDRVDNMRGYLSDNVVSCCRPCNVSKADGSLTGFLDRARRIAEIHP